MTIRVQIRRVTLAAALAAACGGNDPSCDEPGVICRVAGNGERAFNGDGLGALDTAFYLPSATRVGPDGRLYVMDFNNMRLRVIEDDGTVATVAGSGDHYYARTGEPAVDSPLENPIDFGFLPGGEIVFASLHDPRVLRVDLDGMLRLVAGTGNQGDSGDGGPAASAQFTELQGLAVAGDGRIFVADAGANRVRVIHPSGLVEAFAGTGEAGYGGDGGPAVEATLHRPAALALGPDGSLYVADADNHVVRRVGPDGLIETAAGSGVAGGSGDGGPATAAQLDMPEGVAFGGGRLFIGEWRGHRIRVVEDGVIETLAGTGARGPGGDGGPAASAKLAGPARLEIRGDTLYFADQIGDSIRSVALPPPRSP